MRADEEIIYPRFSVTNDEHNYVTSTYWLEDASYVRLKSAEIGYTMEGRFLKKNGNIQFQDISERQQPAHVVQSLPWRGP